MTPPGVTVGIDLGGTGTRFVSLNDDGRVTRHATHRTPRGCSADDAIRFLTHNIDTLTQGNPINTVGIGASGPIDRDGTIQNPDTLPAFTGAPIAQALRDRYNVPVAVDTDAVTAALGEYRYGEQTHAPSMLVITLGTGIGTCLLIDGVPFRGSDGMPPEGGHLTVSAAAPPCYCGRQHCFEQAASRTALQHAAARVAAVPEDDRNAIRLLASMADTGQLAAREAFDDYGRALAEGVGTLAEVYRPGEIVLAGAAASQIRHFEQSLHVALAALAPWVPTMLIRPTRLGDLIGAIGAAELATRGLNHD